MQVRYSDVAAAILSQMKARALANPESANATVYAGIKRVLTDLLPVEHRAIQRQYGMHDELSDFFRVRVGRLRIIWGASTQRGLVIVLFVGKRKEGDKHDVYVDFARRLKAGTFDDQLSELGLDRRKRSG